MKIIKDISTYVVAFIVLLLGCAFASEIPETPALHVVGVYTSPRGSVEIIITDDSRPIVLALYAYEKTNWRISAKKGVKIERILLEGYHSQTVTGIASDTKVDISTYDHSPCEPCFRLSRAIGNSHKAPAVRNLKTLTGLDVTSFQGLYSEATFSIFPGMQQYQDKSKPQPQKGIQEADIKRPISYKGERCPEFSISVEDEVASRMEDSNGCEIDSITIACEYISGSGPRETWFYNKCGKSEMSITETSYNPELHPNGHPPTVEKSRFADELQKRMFKNVMIYELDFGNGDGLILNGFDCDDPTKSGIVNRANHTDVHFSDNVIKHICIPTDSGGATVQVDRSVINVSYPWSRVEFLHQK